MTPSRKRRNHCSPRATAGSSVSPSRNTAHDYHHLRITHFNSSHHSNHLVAVKLPESTLETLPWVLRRSLSVPLPLLASAHRRSQSQGPITTTTLQQVQPSSRNHPASCRHSQLPGQATTTNTKPVVKTFASTASAMLTTVQQYSDQNAHKLASMHPKTI